MGHQTDGGAGPGLPVLCLSSHVGRPADAQLQVDVLRLEIAEESDEVRQAAAQAIHGPRCYEVELPSSNRVQQRVEPRAILPTFGAADSVVDMLGSDQPTASLNAALSSRSCRWPPTPDPILICGKTFLWRRRSIGGVEGSKLAFPTLAVHL